MVFSSVGSASATVVSGNVDDDHVIVVDNPTVSKIQQAVNDANNYDDILIKGSATDTGNIKCDKVLTITGENCTLNKIHWSSTKDISFEKISFKNSNSDYGGALYVDGSVNLINCTFYGNSVGTEGGAVWSDDSVTVNNCLFEYNYVGDYVGDDSYGGAIYMDDSYDLKVSNSSFYNNHANDNGGAIYCEGNFAHVYLDSFNSFEDNTAHEGKVVFADGYFESIKNNWWGSADPDWDNGLVVEWKCWPWDNINHHDDSPLDYNPNL